MRWDGLFADLEAQADALALAERAGEIEERARIEVGRQRLVDRLRAALGAQVRLQASGDVSISGVLRRVGPEWALLEDASRRETVVVLASVQSVAGLSRLAAGPDSGSVIESRLGLRHALRGIARDRSPVRAHLADGSTLDGTLDRVGVDFVDLATHGPGELRRRGEVREVLVLPLAALVAVTRDT